MALCRHFIVVCNPGQGHTNPGVAFARCLLDFDSQNIVSLILLPNAALDVRVPELLLPFKSDPKDKQAKVREPATRVKGDSEEHESDTAPSTAVPHGATGDLFGELPANSATLRLPRYRTRVLHWQFQEEEAKSPVTAFIWTTGPDAHAALQQHFCQFFHPWTCDSIATKQQHSVTKSPTSSLGSSAINPGHPAHELEPLDLFCRTPVTAVIHDFLAGWSVGFVEKMEATRAARVAKLDELPLPRVKRICLHGSPAFHNLLNYSHYVWDKSGSISQEDLNEIVGMDIIPADYTHVDLAKHRELMPIIETVWHHWATSDATIFPDYLSWYTPAVQQRVFRGPCTGQPCGRHANESGKDDGSTFFLGGLVRECLPFEVIPVGRVREEKKQDARLLTEGAVATPSACMDLLRKGGWPSDFEDLPTAVPSSEAQYSGSPPVRTRANIFPESSKAAGIVDDETPTAMRFLDAHPEGVIFVAFGSATVPNEQDAAVLSRVLHAVGRSVLQVGKNDTPGLDIAEWNVKWKADKQETERCEKLVRVNDKVEKRNSEMGGPSDNNGEWVKRGSCAEPPPALRLRWVDQRRILQHPNVGVFVSHVGWSSTVEAVRFEVPIAAFPIAYDQKEVAVMLARQWKFGTMLRMHKAEFSEVKRELERAWSERTAIKARMKSFNEMAATQVREHKARLWNLLRAP